MGKLELIKINVLASITFPGRLTNREKESQLLIQGRKREAKKPKELRFRRSQG